MARNVKLLLRIPDLLNSRLIYGKTKVKVKATFDDIHIAVCRDHANCMGAVAIRREGDGEVTRVDFEANEVRFTYGGFRWVFHPSAEAMNMLRDFDELGEVHGQATARRMMPEREFTLTFLDRKKLPNHSEATKAKRAARSKADYEKRETERKALGLPARKRPSRTVGVTLKAQKRLNPNEMSFRIEPVLPAR